ncbi:MAG TPA: MarR family transcriptional regulator [Ktedonobacterales bacterium]|nr:MarR family transcriptional regulator [Ktedonobacterales bacterium]
MERPAFPDHQQITAALLKFVFFLGGMVNERQWHFEQEMEGCHPEDVRVLFLWMEPRGPLMVKEIAQELHGVSQSTLTRMLDRLEQYDYIKRMLNPQDRRSFQVMLTERGQQAVARFLEEWHAVAQGVLGVLTPTEQLILIELLNKMQQHWPAS